jgi:hypothetical protein
MFIVFPWSAIGASVQGTSPKGIDDRNFYGIFSIIISS